MAFRRVVTGFNKAGKSCVKWDSTIEQKKVAEDTIADVDASGLWPGKVVTEVTAAGPFWEAEPEHQDYLQHYPNGYTCHFVRPGWKLPHRAETAS